jgi:hypothetical protein
MQRCTGMRLLLLLSIVTMLTAYRCQQDRNDHASLPEKKDSVAIATLKNAHIDFKTSIQPILKLHCVPCHFPGGKMYAKMPFDTATTIIAHREGILRRIKDPSENEKLRLFIEQITPLN